MEERGVRSVLRVALRTMHPGVRAGWCAGDGAMGAPSP